MPEVGTRTTRHRRARLPRRLDAQGTRSTSARSPVGFDLGSDDARLRLVLSDEERARVTLVEGDVTDAAALGRALDEHGITNVVHLAALQVPFCRADPERGARVNVHGTVVVFEAVKARLEPDPRPRVRELDGRLQRLRSLPRSRVGRHRAVDPLRGVQARERGHGARLLGRRRRRLDRDPPVRRVRAGRDQGLTSGPSLAMEAAARGEATRSRYGGTAQYDFAPDVGRAFALAARAATEGAHVANFPGVPSTMQEVVDAIEAAAPAVAGRVFWDEGQLPFPER